MMSNIDLNRPPPVEEDVQMSSAVGDNTTAEPRMTQVQRVQRKAGEFHYKMMRNIDLNRPPPVEEDVQMSSAVGDNTTAEPRMTQVQRAVEPPPELRLVMDLYWGVQHAQTAAVGLPPLPDSLTSIEPMEHKNGQMTNVKLPQQGEYMAVETSLRLQQQLMMEQVWTRLEARRAAVGLPPLHDTFTRREPMEHKNGEITNVKLPQQGEYMGGKALVPPMPTQRKEIAITCPICMDKMVEETSTKCGHIFCKACINAALAKERKCPICRKKHRLNGTRRIHLPALRN